MKSRIRERAKNWNKLFRTRVWINKDRKTRVGGEEKEIKKKKEIETKMEKWRIRWKKKRWRK